MQSKGRARFLCAILALWVATASAGSSIPPAAPASTVNLAEPRTPITAVPVTIEQSGSYFLTGDLTMSGDGHGIVVLADDVTIDLNGFALIGDDAALAGIAITTEQFGLSLENLTVLNGTVRGWPEGGIDFQQAVFPSRAEGIHVSDCGGSGIYLGNEAVVRNCTVENCTGQFGIAVNVDSTIENCVARGNSGVGIRTGDASVVRGCVARDNGDDGIAADGSVIDCSASDNTDRGISLGAGSVVSGCSSEGNGTGIGGTAIAVANCYVNTSGSVGIDAGNRSSVRDCTVVVTNVIADIDGIIVEDDCLVIGNHLRGHVNGSAIIVNGDRNRIEANSVVSAVTGIGVVGSNNLVIRNSFTNVTTNIGAPLNPNTFGPTITSASIGTDGNPHANYEH